MHITFKKFFLTSLLSLTIILTTLVIVTSIQKDIEVKKEEQERQAVIAAYAKKDMEVQTQEKQRQNINNKILESAAVQPAEVNIDYSKQISTGSPLVFGGSQTPPVDQKDAWDQFEEVGVTSIRKDLYLEFNAPSNISVDEYEANVNDVKNIKNWDTEGINGVKQDLKTIKSHGMKTMGIMGYAPSWLTYNNSPFGVPTNWDVFKHLVKTYYREYRDQLDYIEIWNEPDHKIFLVTEGSPYTKAEAYKEIYYYASNAIREVDEEKKDGKKVLIGAAVESNPTVSNILGSVVSDPKINIKPDFISFHNYDLSYDKFYDVYKEDRQKYLDPNTPIFLTEWNLENAPFDVKPYKTGNPAILYTANRFMDYFQDNISGANYFAMLPLNTKRSTDESTMGFYRWENNKAELLPQARTWRLLSSKIGLGKGNSKIMDVSQDSIELRTLGFTNALNQNGIAIINQSVPQMVTLNFNNIGINKYAKVEIYYASEDNDAKTPIYTGDIKANSNNVKLNVYAPSNTLIGVTVTEEKEWFDIFSPLK